MKNINLFLLFICYCFSASLATRYIRSVKSPQRFHGGSYSSGAPVSPSRSRYSGPSTGGSYGGSNGFSAASALASSGASSYGGSPGFSAPASTGSYGGFGGGSEQQQYEEHPAPEPYNFQYAANDEYGNNQYRNEEQDQSGTIRGSYGYTDANGLYRVVDYVADNDGFRASIRSNEPGGLTELNPTTGSVDNPADIQLSAEPVPSGIRQQQEQYQRYSGAGAQAGAAAGAGKRYNGGGAGGPNYSAGSSGGAYGGGATAGAHGGTGYGSSSGGFGGHSGSFGGTGSGFRPITQQKLRTYSDKY